MTNWFAHGAALVAIVVAGFVPIRQMAAQIAMPIYGSSPGAGPVIVVPAADTPPRDCIPARALADAALALGAVGEPAIRLLPSPISMPLSRINDETAVRAAMTSFWSNRETEGHIKRLKLVKQQMYGRAKIDLLQARIIGALCPTCTRMA